MAADPNKVYRLKTDGEAGLISDADTDNGFERVRRCYSVAIEISHRIGRPLRAPPKIRDCFGRYKTVGSFGSPRCRSE
jgi:hypothetical protein